MIFIKLFNYSIYLKPVEVQVLLFLRFVSNKWLNNKNAFDFSMNTQINASE